MADITLITAYLDFPWNTAEHGRIVRLSHLPGLGNEFPAVYALEYLGKYGFPAIIEFLGRTRTSELARSNAEQTLVTVDSTFHAHAHTISLLLEASRSHSGDRARSEQLRRAAADVAATCTPLKWANAEAPWRGNLAEPHCSTSVTRAPSGLPTCLTPS